MFSVIDVHESGDGPLYVEDVFSAFTYTGNGSTQSIVNGIDLAGKGGLVWLKDRSAANSPGLFDTDRGVNQFLRSNATDAQSTQALSLTAFNSGGFSIGSNSLFNTNSNLEVGWTFRKAKKFFDVKTYTGNGVAGRQIAHDLGVAPGMIIVKNLTQSTNWWVWHKDIAIDRRLELNTTNSLPASGNYWGGSTPTDSYFSVGGATEVNGSSGNQYVAYIFAHDDSADGIIQCGTFNTASEVNLGWEPQYMLVKRVDAAQDWFIFDTSRGWDLSVNDKWLAANLSQAEATNSYGNPTPAGFLPANLTGTYVYLAIRKGLMRKPTDASKVFDLVSRTGNGGTAAIVSSTIKTGVDLIIAKKRSSGTARSHMWSDRTRGTDSQLASDSTGGEATSTLGVRSFNMDGVGLGSLNTVNANSDIYINEMFKQARGFFDIVGYTGTGAARTVPHNLGAVPELMIIKRRNAASNWPVYFGDSTRYIYLNNATSDNPDGADRWNLLSPTDSLINLGTHAEVNASGGNYLAYLFSSCPGVLKTGTFAGNGTTINIPCGFTAGARFVLMRDIGGGAGWQYCDATRGIVSGSDPALFFNSTNAESVVYDTLQPLVGGFGVNYESTYEFNKSGRNYWYMAIA